MPKVRALWITSHYPNPASPVAGVFFRTQARGLVRAGADVTVVAATPRAPQPLPLLSEKWRQYHETPKALTDHGVSVVYRRYLAMPNQVRRGIPDLMIYAAVKGFLKSERFDLIHGHYSYPEGLAAVRLGRALGKPVIVTLHGDDASTYPDMDGLAKRRFRKAVEGASHVIAVSDKLADKTEDVTGKRPEMAPIGVDLSRYSTAQDSLSARRTLSVPQDDFVVLFVGFLEDRKGMAELIEALKDPELGEVTCVVVGDGSWAGAISELPNVRFEGLQPNEIIPQYLAASDVLVLPSREEGTPTVVVEAGAAGLPVIATSVGGTSTLLAEDRGLLIPPRAPASLSSAIKAVRSDMSSARARAARLKSFVHSYYDVESTSKRLLSTYRTLCAQYETRRVQGGA